MRGKKKDFCGENSGLGELRYARRRLPFALFRRGIRGTLDRCNINWSGRVPAGSVRPRQEKVRMENNGQSTIANGVEITGTVKTAGSIQIDGVLNGDLNCEGNATIGQGATIKGGLNVSSVTIAGSVQGNINAIDRIEMKSTAKVVGDIKAKRLAVEDGVTFNGKSEVSPSGAPTAAPAQSSEKQSQGGGGSRVIS